MICSVKVGLSQRAEGSRPLVNVIRNRSPAWMGVRTHTWPPHRQARVLVITLAQLLKLRPCLIKYFLFQCVNSRPEKPDIWKVWLNIRSFSDNAELGERRRLQSDLTAAVRLGNDFTPRLEQKLPNAHGMVSREAMVSREVMVSHLRGDFPDTLSLNSYVRFRRKRLSFVVMASELPDNQHRGCLVRASWFKLVFVYFQPTSRFWWVGRF